MRGQRGQSGCYEQRICWIKQAVQLSNMLTIQPIYLLPGRIHVQNLSIFKISFSCPLAIRAEYLRDMIRHPEILWHSTIHRRRKSDTPHPMQDLQILWHSTIDRGRKTILATGYETYRHSNMAQRKANRKQPSQNHRDGGDSIRPLTMLPLF